MPLLGLLGLDCHGGHPAGGKVMPLPHPGLVPPPPLELAMGAALLELCLEQSKIKE